LPEQFKTWGDAVKAAMNAQKENITPDEVDPDIWTVFETVAFELIPRVNR
jgi:hypothetical protein